MALDIKILIQGTPRRFNFAQARSIAQERAYLRFKPCAIHNSPYLIHPPRSVEVVPMKPSELDDKCDFGFFLKVDGKEAGYAVAFARTVHNEYLAKTFPGWLLDTNATNEPMLKVFREAHGIDHLVQLTQSSWYPHAYLDPK